MVPSNQKSSWQLDKDDNLSSINDSHLIIIIFTLFKLNNDNYSSVNDSHLTSFSCCSSSFSFLLAPTGNLPPDSLESIRSSQEVEVSILLSTGFSQEVEVSILLSTGFFQEVEVSILLSAGGFFRRDESPASILSSQEVSL